MPFRRGRLFRFGRLAANPVHIFQRILARNSRNAPANAQYFGETIARDDFSHGKTKHDWFRVSRVCLKNVEIFEVGADLDYFCALRAARESFGTFDFFFFACFGFWGSERNKSQK